jgi:hypothetical protein
MHISFFVVVVVVVVGGGGGVALVYLARYRNTKHKQGVKQAIQKKKKK